MSKKTITIRNSHVVREQLEHIKRFNEIKTDSGAFIFAAENYQKYYEWYYKEQQKANDLEDELDSLKSAISESIDSINLIKKIVGHEERD